MGARPATVLNLRWTVDFSPSPAPGMALLPGPLVSGLAHSPPTGALRCNKRQRWNHAWRVVKTYAYAKGPRKLSAQRDVMEALRQLVVAGSLKKRFRRDYRLQHLQKADVEDLHQEFVREFIERIKNKCTQIINSPPSYIKRAADNFVASHIRRAANPKKREPRVEYVGDCDELMEQAAADKRGVEAVKSDHTADERVAVAETYRIMMQAIEKMPPQRARVFRMVLKGQSLGDVAKQLGIAASTATNHYSRALQDVIKALRAQAENSTDPPQEPTR